jgi:GH24 family phage-related lysozyme (muramidase)
LRVAGWRASGVCAFGGSMTRPMTAWSVRAVLAVLVSAGAVAAGALVAVAPAAHAAASSPGSTGHTTHTAVTASAPCVASVSTPDCTSTDPLLTIDWVGSGDTAGCTFTWSIDWGDKSVAQQVTVGGQPQSGDYFLASHTYHAARTTTFSVAASDVSATGGCSISPGAYKFTFDVAKCACKGITAAEEKVIAREEARGGKPVLRPYNDSEGYCTIGLGHLISKRKCTPADIAKWKGVTASKLIELFHQDLAKAERDLNKILISKLHLKLSPCQYNALFDLYFNGGPSWFGPKTRLYKALRARDMSAVPAILASDVPAKANAKTKKGIKARRKRDANQFATRDCPCTSSISL